jgi:hypothetical protein
MKENPPPSTEYEEIMASDFGLGKWLGDIVNVPL